jgi:flavorubredoxin
METRIDEVADDIFRLSTFISDPGIMFNQFIVRDDEALLFHTGLRSLFPLVSDAVKRVVPLERLRWITFGHVESDECGTMNEFLAIAPNAVVAHGALGCMVQVNDLADRAPRPLADGEVIELGTRRVRHIDTPHLPHGWDAGVMFEETTGTLFAGDLFTRYGDSTPTTTDDMVAVALDAEQFGGPTALTPATGPKLRALADLEPVTLAIMHGPTYKGDGATQLVGLAEGYETMLRDAEAVRV